MAVAKPILAQDDPRERLIFAVITAAAVLGAIEVGPTAAAVPSLDEARHLQRAGQCREAVPLYMAIADDARDRDRPTAASALNNACLCLLDLGELERAEGSCNEALSFRRALDDAPRLARALNNTGRVVMRLGRHNEAARLFREALEINRANGVTVSEVRNLGNLGVLAIYAGRYGEALEIYRRIETIANANADAAWADDQRRLALLNEGVVLERLGAFEEALDRYQTLRDEGEAMPPRERASLLANLGTLYRNLGDPVRAAESVREAAALAASVDNLAGTANAEINLGIILHENLKQPDAAEVAYQRALGRSREIGDSDLIIESALNLGRLLMASERRGEALELFQLAETTAAQSGSIDALARSLTGLGRLHAADGDLDQAQAHLQSAMSVLEGVREGIESVALRARYLQNRRSVYESLVEVLVAMESRDPDGDHARRALEVVERAKHRDLLDAIGRGDDLAPSTAADLQAVAGDALFIEYFFGERHLHRWIIDRERIEHRRIADRHALDAGLREAHRAWAEGGAPRPTALAALARALLDGIDLSSYDRVFIAPDGLLHYLPFETLELPDAPGSTVLDTVTVSYIPSGSLLTHGRAASADRARASGRAPNQRLIAFGAPSNQDDVASPLRGLLSTRFALEPLAARELESISRALGGRATIFRGADATESTFRDAARQGARVIHLATHTVIDENMASRAAVLLTPTIEDDGLLYPEEIAALELDTDLTLLAACSTALGGNEDGRGLTSLTGSFLAAGSRAVIATLWDVDDGATAVFMEQLYHQLGRGSTPADALRATKQRMRGHATWSAPSLWSAYVLVGDAPAVAPNRLAPRLLMISVLAVLGIGLVAWWRLRRPATRS